MQPSYTGSYVAALRQVNTPQSDVRRVIQDHDLSRNILQQLFSLRGDLGEWAALIEAAPHYTRPPQCNHVILWRLVYGPHQVELIFQLLM
jgi:hypothetical protein